MPSGIPITIADDQRITSWWTKKPNPPNLAAPGVVVGGKMVYKYPDHNHYTSFDGKNCVNGGIVPNNSLSIPWTDGTRLYNFSSVQYKDTITHGDVTSGPFIVGEPVTQGAKWGWFVSQTDATHMVIARNVGSGAFTATGTITGTTSGATTDPSAVASATTSFLTVSDTPSSDAYPVLEVSTINYQNAFVDCGHHDFGSGGTYEGDKHLVLFFLQLGSTSLPAIIALFPDETDGTRNPITLTSGLAVTIIRHWHGATYISGVAGVAADHMLVAYTGDAANTASILVCRDVVSFVNSHATWVTRWGLDIAGGDRPALLNAANYEYAVGTLNKYSGYPALKPLCFVPNATKTHGYFIVDAPDAVGGVTGYTHAVRVNLSTLVADVVPTAEQITVGGVTGYFITGIGGGGILTQNGYVVLSTGSEYINPTTPTVYEGINRLYKINEANNLCEMIYQVARKRNDTGAFYSGTMVEYPLSDGAENSRIYSQYQENNTGKYVCGTIGTPRHLEIPDYTLLVNGYFANTGSWTANTPYATASIDTTVIDPVVGGAGSMKITPATGSNTSPQISQDLAAADVALLAGKWLTLSIRFKQTVASQAYFYVSAQNGTSYTAANYAEGVSRSWNYDPLSLDWQELSIPIFIRTNVTKIRVVLMARSGEANLQDPIWVSRVVLVPGSKIDAVPVSVPTRAELIAKTDVPQRVIKARDATEYVILDSNESRRSDIVITGTGNTNLLMKQFPGATWLVHNTLASGTITVLGGTAITIAVGKSRIIRSDGTTIT